MPVTVTRNLNEYDNDDDYDDDYDDDDDDDDNDNEGEEDDEKEQGGRARGGDRGVELAETLTSSANVCMAAQLRPRSADPSEGNGNRLARGRPGERERGPGRPRRPRRGDPSMTAYLQRTRGRNTTRV